MSIILTYNNAMLFMLIENHFKIYEPQAILQKAGLLLYAPSMLLRQCISNEQLQRTLMLQQV